ncbi:MAG: hypothetical protein ACREV4_11755 [Gammaproteobacteria bacterium]
MRSRVEKLETWSAASKAFPKIPDVTAPDDWATTSVTKVKHVEEIPRFTFQTFYHPYVCSFTKRLAESGIDGLLRWSSESDGAQFESLTLFGKNKRSAIL